MFDWFEPDQEFEARSLTVVGFPGETNSSTINCSKWLALLQTISIGIETHLQMNSNIDTRNANGYRSNHFPLFEIRNESTNTFLFLEERSIRLPDANAKAEEQTVEIYDVERQELFSTLDPVDSAIHKKSFLNVYKCFHWFQFCKQTFLVKLCNCRQSKLSKIWFLSLITRPNAWTKHFIPTNQTTKTSRKRLTAEQSEVFLPTAFAVWRSKLFSP